MNIQEELQKANNQYAQLLVEKRQLEVTVRTASSRLDQIEHEISVVEGAQLVLSQQLKDESAEAEKA